MAFSLLYHFKYKQNGERRRFFKKRFSLRSSLALVPHLFTLGNAFFGFYSMIMASRGEFTAAAYFILMGALMDALDGRIARIIGCESDLGMQLDSLSDAVSFCVAPAFLVYAWYFSQFEIVGVFWVSLLVMTGILRLARFNLIVEDQSRYLIGLPTTIVGCLLACLVLNTQFFLEHRQCVPIIFLIVPLLSWLMISRVKFLAFKKTKFLNKRYSIGVLSFGGFITTFIVGFPLAMLIFFVLYFLIALTLNFTNYYSQKND